MKLCVVTSAYNLRKTRPFEYYLTPTIHMLQDFANQNLDVCVFTDQKESLFPSAKNIRILNTSPEELIKYFWDDPDWKNIYTTALEKRSSEKLDRCEQRVVPELIAIWLGKMSMIKLASDTADIVLWQDSGIRLFRKQIENYRKRTLFSSKYNSFTELLATKHALTFLAHDRQVNPLHGVCMKKYKINNPVIAAGLILTISSEANRLQETVREKWQTLINNKDYGTEENAINLCEFDNHAILSYEDWTDGLGLNSTVSFL